MAGWAAYKVSGAPILAHKQQFLVIRYSINISLAISIKNSCQDRLEFNSVTT